MMKSTTVLKTDISETTIEEVSYILTSQENISVAICNANSLVRSVKNSELKKAINSFEIKTPDGFPVAKALSILSKKKFERVDGYKVFLEIDWQGAVSVLQQYPDATSIFISPPSIEELRIRLEKRGLDSQDVIDKRVQGAVLEMKKAKKFRHQITNISLDIATKNLLNIIFREKYNLPNKFTELTY